MARIVGIVVAALLLLVGLGAINVYQQVSSFEVAKVTDDLLGEDAKASRRR